MSLLLSDPAYRNNYYGFSAKQADRLIVNLLAGKPWITGIAEVAKEENPHTDVDKFNSSLSQAAKEQPLLIRNAMVLRLNYLQELNPKDTLRVVKSIINQIAQNLNLPTTDSMKAILDKAIQQQSDIQSEAIGNKIRKLLDIQA